MQIERKGNLSGPACLALILLFVFLFTPPGLSAQERLPQIRVTIPEESRSVNQVLEEITLQTGYYFTYNAALIAGEKKVFFGVEELLLEKTLDSLLGHPRMSYRLINRNIVIYQKNESPPNTLNDSIDRSFLKGRIVDAKTGNPLAYATIALTGSSLGSISNQSGEFSFKIPASIQDPMLVISYIGYKSRILPVKYPIEEEVTVGLEKDMVSLQEVIIRYTDPEILLAEALDRIPLNYLNEPSAMTAFYRESVKRNKRFMVHSEAVLDVAKAPYDLDIAADRVRIRKGRKITDISAEDTVFVKLRSGIHNSLGLDVIKNRPDFLTDGFPERYDLEFTDMMTYGGKLVYVVSFHQKNHIEELLFRGRIYLDQENLALVAVDFEYNPDLIHKEPGLFLVSRSPKIRIKSVFGRYHADYRLSEGRYHISQVRAEVGMKIRKRRQWIGARYTISIEMAITNIEPETKLQIGFSERVRPDQVLSDQHFHFDPTFWGVYNTIEPEATLMESIRRIESNLCKISE